MSIVGTIRRHGVLESARYAAKKISDRARKAKGDYYHWNVRKAPRYSNPTTPELTQIETELSDAGVEVYDYTPNHEDFIAFQAANYFPLDYHGGINGPVWEEKLLEHWISAERLGLMNYQPDDVYVDVAAGNSPWAKAVRERLGISAFAIDLEIGAAFNDLTYYRVENATKTKFADASVKGASLQCAYEMFMNDDDINLIKELARILQPEGKAVIAPLYMHTHYCSFSTPEYYGKGYSDPAAKEYVYPGMFGVPSSRKYDAKELMSRVLVTIESLGMSYKLLVLRGKADYGKDIYCHFILEITK